MAVPDVLNPHPPDFERFLYASVGKDRNGAVVTVLSAFARLGLDPWNETATLVTLGRGAARTRLGLLLSRFRDVPALGHDHGSIARELSLLLPEPEQLRSNAPEGSAFPRGRLVSSPAIWTIILIAFALIQLLFNAVPGTGG